jgi:hypothetical protein
MTERDFGTIHLEYPRIAARRAKPRANRAPWQEAELHQALRYVFGKVEAVQNGLFSTAKIGQRPPDRVAVLATQLH